MTVSDVPSRFVEIEEDEIRESMLEVLDALLDAMPALEEPVGAASAVTLQGTIEILTPASPALSIRTNQAVARKLAVGWSLVGDDGSASDADAVDAMSEFTNLAGGSMKFLFSEESALGLPKVQSFDQTPEYETHHWVDVDHPVGYFQVELHPAPAE